jgi:osmotically-inducible protein OsmY
VLAALAAHADERTRAIHPITSTVEERDMAFGNFWRGRERFGSDRNRDRGRTGGDWRDEERERRYWRENERQGMSDRDASGPGSSGEYYGERWRDYGGEDYGGERQRGPGYGAQPGRSWERNQRYGSPSGRDWEQERDVDQERDWRSQYASAYGRDYERDYPSRSSYGASEESDWDYVGGYSRSGRGSLAQGMQQHRGKGPRGYRRSDERIREDLCDCLTDDPFLDASDIEVTVEGAEVILVGSVSSRDDKRRAEDLAESISGVKDVRNSLRVTNERSREWSQASGQSAGQAAGQRSTTGQQGQTQQGPQTGRH